MLEKRNESLHALMHSFKKIETLVHQLVCKNIRPKQSHSQLYVLMRLIHARKAGIQGLRISDIAKEMGVSVPAATQLVTGLEKEGFIRRQIDPGDRRAVLVYLLPKSEEIMMPAIESVRELFGGLIDKLGPDDTRKLIEILDKTEQYFSEVGKV